VADSFSASGGDELHACLASYITYAAAVRKNRVCVPSSFLPRTLVFMNSSFGCKSRFSRSGEDM
jgi:hypothetical protein